MPVYEFTYVEVLWGQIYIEKQVITVGSGEKIKSLENEKEKETKITRGDNEKTEKKFTSVFLR